MRRRVSKVVKDAYGSSPRAPTVDAAGTSAVAGGVDEDGDGELTSYAGAAEGRVGPDAAFGSAV